MHIVLFAVISFKTKDNLSDMVENQQHCSRLNSEEKKQKKVKVKYSPLMFQRVSIPPNPLFSALILHGRISTTTN